MSGLEMGIELPGGQESMELEYDEGSATFWPEYAYDSDHLEHSTEPTSVSRDPFDEANEYEDWSGNLSKRNFSLDYSVVARAFAQRPRNLRPDQIAMTGDHRLSRNVVSEQLPTSLRNTVQILAEKAIGSAIDWWPLTEPRRDFVRVTWSCDCDALRSMSVARIIGEDSVCRYDSESFGSRETKHTQVAKIHKDPGTTTLTKWLGVLESLTTDLLEHVGTTFWIDIPKWIQVSGLCLNLQNDTTALQYNNTTVTPPSNAAAAQAQQTKLPTTQNVQSPPMQNSSNLQGASNSPAGINQGHTVPSQAFQAYSGKQQLPRPELHIFMTSKVGGYYLLSQWNTLMPRPQNDREFFRELRKCYISARGFWRYHLGFKVFSHCEFYRLKKHGQSTFSISTKELPECATCSKSSQSQCAEHQAYYYAPKPARRNPPLDPEDFYIHFHACQHRRAAQTFRWHRCRHVPTRSDEAVRMIPRRETRLDLSLDQAEVFWGLLVKEKYSILAIMIYNLLAMTPTLAFFFWWIFGSPEKDLSNGSVPAALTLAELSLFWAIIVSMKMQES